MPFIQYYAISMITDMYLSILSRSELYFLFNLPALSPDIEPFSTSCINKQGAHLLYNNAL